MRAEAQFCESFSWSDESCRDWISFVAQLVKNGSQDCFQGRVQRLLWGGVNLERTEDAYSCIQNTHIHIFSTHLVFIFTLVKIFIVWSRKLVSTSWGIGRRWAAQSRMHSKVSLWPCQRAETILSHYMTHHTMISFKSNNINCMNKRLSSDFNISLFLAYVHSVVTTCTYL